MDELSPDERASQEGRQAEARALAWALSPPGTPYNTEPAPESMEEDRRDVS